MTLFLELKTVKLISNPKWERRLFNNSGNYRSILVRSVAPVWTAAVQAPVERATVFLAAVLGEPAAGSQCAERRQQQRRKISEFQGGSSKLLRSSGSPQPMIHSFWVHSLATGVPLKISATVD